MLEFYKGLHDHAVEAANKWIDDMANENAALTRVTSCHKEAHRSINFTIQKKNPQTKNKKKNNLRYRIIQ